MPGDINPHPGIRVLASQSPPCTRYEARVDDQGWCIWDRDKLEVYDFPFYTGVRDQDWADKQAWRLNRAYAEVRS